MHLLRIQDAQVVRVQSEAGKEGGVKRDTEADILLQAHLKKLGFTFEREWRFDAPRRWRVDYAVSRGRKLQFAVEIEGGAYIQGRHSRGKGFEADCIKYNTLATRDVPLLRFTTGQIKRGEDIVFLECFASLERMTIADDGLPALLAVGERE